MTGIEPVASSLPRTRSTPELHRLKSSGRRGSNSRHSAWKADALPTELLPLGNLFQCHMLETYIIEKNVGVIGIEPIQSKTTELQSAPALQLRRTPMKFYKKVKCSGNITMSRWRDSNPRPFDYKSNALPLSYTGKKIKEHNP